MSPGLPRSTPPSHGKIVLHIVHIVLHTFTFVNRIGRNIPSFLKVRLRYASKAMSRLVNDFCSEIGAA